MRLESRFHRNAGLLYSWWNRGEIATLQWGSPSPMAASAEKRMRYRLTARRQGSSVGGNQGPRRYAIQRAHAGRCAHRYILNFCTLKPNNLLITRCRLKVRFLGTRVSQSRETEWCLFSAHILIVQGIPEHLCKRLKDSRVY